MTVSEEGLPPSKQGMPAQDALPPAEAVVPLNEVISPAEGTLAPTGEAEPPASATVEHAEPRRIGKLQLHQAALKAKRLKAAVFGVGHRAFSFIDERFLALEQRLAPHLPSPRAVAWAGSILLAFGCGAVLVWGVATASTTRALVAKNEALDAKAALAAEQEKNASLQEAQDKARAELTALKEKQVNAARQRDQRTASENAAAAKGPQALVAPSSVPIATGASGLCEITRGSPDQLAMFVECIKEFNRGDGRK